MTMRNKIIAFIFLVFIFIGILFFKPYLLHGNCLQYEYKEPITVEGASVLVKKVYDIVGREKGLSGACPLQKNTGMLFVFDTPGVHGFWMKDMTFGLDMVWLDKDFHVVDKSRNVTPDTFPNVFYPQGPALYVLELPVGSIDSIPLLNKTDTENTNKKTE